MISVGTLVTCFLLIPFNGEDYNTIAIGKVTLVEPESFYVDFSEVLNLNKEMIKKYSNYKVPKEDCAPVRAQDKK